MTSVLLPPRVAIDYLPHQEIGIRWMLAREETAAKLCRGGVLADDMGLGKTFQTIGLLKNSPHELRTLIVCPPALIAGWKEELTACGFRVSTLLQGTNKWTGGGSVWLTSYPKVSKISDRFGRVILDEGHVIRNGKGTSRWKTCMALAGDSECRWILSATPIQNGPHDWRNLCAWLHVSCAAELIPEIGPTLMLRRTMAELRDDVSALPPPPVFVSHDLSIPAASTEGKLFRVLADQLDNVMEKAAISGLIKLEMWMRIQQFLVHPQVYIDGMRSKYTGYVRKDWTAADSCTKWDACITQIAAGVEEKIGTIVFCNFRAEMDRVAEAATAIGAEVWAIRGGMTSETVGKAVSEARESVEAGKPVVLVVQIVSGGAGLNLQFCSRILFLSQHWNPAIVHQAVGRAVRIGQRAVVQIHMFRVVDDVVDNIDRRMIQVHLSKIAGAQDICETLYEGFAPLVEIPSNNNTVVLSDSATAKSDSEDPV